MVNVKVKRYYEKYQVRLKETNESELIDEVSKEVNDVKIGASHWEPR